MKKYDKNTGFRLVAVLLLVVVVLASVFVLNRYDGMEPLSGEPILPVCSVSNVGKRVALTFDCVSFGPETENLLAVLDEYKLQGSFFITGEKAVQNRSLILKLLNGGHDIGNMSYSYRDMGGTRTSAIKEELQKCSRIIEGMTGEKCVLFRAPYDRYGKRTVKTAAAMGMHAIRYDVDALTWKPEMYQKGIGERLMEQIKPGSIIVFKAEGRFAKETLKETIEELLAEGYHPVKLTDMIYTEHYTVDVSGTQIHDFG